MKRHPNNRNFWKRYKQETKQNHRPNIQYRFFEPFVGKHYTDGINKKRILVLASRIYCDNESCPFFFHCTSVLLKHSLPYEKKCPRHKSTATTLRQEPQRVIEKGSHFLRQIATYMSNYLGTDDYNAIWQSLAFTCYAQFMYPATNGIYPEMIRTELSQEDFNAFIEVVQELRPDIIVVRDNVISTRLMEQNGYIQSIDELAKTNYYVCHLNIPDMDYPIAVIRCPPSFAIDENDVREYIFEYDVEHFDLYFMRLLSN
ncbi:MAG: hypothetical protein MJZ64_05745 [Paludibacteraceae bacterium]|nr:hypothetical protein [Paludibacteraceae bacterium]